MVEKFREKYGTKDMKKHCSEFDVSVLVTTRLDQAPRPEHLNSTLSGSNPTRVSSSLDLLECHDGRFLQILEMG